MKKKSEKWQEIAENESDEGAKRYAERRAFQERQKEDAMQDRVDSFWGKVNGS
jgi:hypothetical protein